MDEKVKIYVVDDDEAVRSSLRLLLRSAGYSVEAMDSADSFLEDFKPGSAGCLLLDVRMPGMSGLELQKVLKERQIGIPVIIITGHGDITMAVDAMKSGAFDFLEKPFNDSELLDRVAEAVKTDLDEHHHAEALKEQVERLKSLTAREHEVMDLMVAGRLNKQIAWDLDISVRTVETHRARVMEKLGVRSLSEVVRIALTSEQEGLNASAAGN